MIELRNISVAIDGCPILKNVSARIDQGDIITIIGPNGAGKSTLLELIAGTIIPTHGAIVIDGCDVTKMHARERACLVGRLCQNPNLNVVNTMTVEENLMLAHLKGTRATLSRAMHSSSAIGRSKLLKRMELDNLLKRSMGMLSGGQRQAIAFAMVTCNNPNILLLDEPTAALDPASAHALFDYAIEYIKEHAITTLLITHDLHLAQRIGNKLWIVEDGRIVSQTCAC